MTYATGLFKQVTYKVEATFGIVPVATSAQALRRVKSLINLTKDTYKSNEIRPDLQKADFRHGVRRVKGKITGELSAGTYKDFFAWALKRDFVAITAITGASITIAGAGPIYTLTRATGSYLTDGIKVGHVVRLSVGTFNAANLAKNLFVVSVTALVATVVVLNASALVAEGPIATATVTVIGKTTYIPTSGHTDKSFSLEHFMADIGQSEVFSGCKVDQITLNLPPTGMATVDIDVMGQGVTTAAAQYFTSPTTITSTGVFAAVNGVLRVNGVTAANITGLTLTINPGFTGDPVVGANVIPNLFPGSVEVSGQCTAYFDTVALRDAFYNETEIDLYACFTADNTAAADFLSVGCPRIKVNDASKDDGESGLIQTFPFMALLAINGGAGTATEKTTIQVQDAQA
jgi:hypothetical protein